MADIKLADLSSCNEIYSWKLLPRIKQHILKDINADSRYLWSSVKELESRTTWDPAVMSKGVEAAGHEKLRKIQLVSYQKEPLRNCRDVRNCLNGPRGETHYNPQELKDQTDLAVVHFKSGSPGAHRKRIVWEKFRATHAQYPHHDFKAAIITHAVSHTELILQYSVIQVSTGSHPSIRQLQCWDKSSHWPAVHHKAWSTRQNGFLVLFRLWKRNNRVLQYAVWPGTWLSH